ncbi:PIN domain-like protein [Mycena alexandri]|uniref:PIN domain-like protein n=1 Tax=Mycena alexandri TaxID=1745969 RepID=A0AAD6SMG1_9AGAR|nr:PIN domain-like protein [Mycena alexandri]
MSESSHGSRASGRARFRRTFRSRGIAVVNRGNWSRISVVSIVSVRAQRELVRITDVTDMVDNSPNPEIQALFYRLAQFLSLPMNAVFVFDRSSKPHPLATQFQDLIEAFGYHWYTAPGKADAELASLETMGITQFLTTTDVDAFIFGARAVMFPCAVDSKNTDKTEVTAYLASHIFINPDVGLSRGGLLLVAQLLGGDDYEGIPQCGVQLAHAVARGPLGEDLLSETLEQDQEITEISGDFIQFLCAWRRALARQFATDPYGYLGVERSTLLALLLEWGVAEPSLTEIAGLCQGQFSWGAARISKQFTQHLYSGIAMQSLLKPYNLNALLEAHIDHGMHYENELPRSAILRFIKEKKTPYLELYQIEISTTVLSLRTKSGLRDASAFPTTGLMIQNKGCQPQGCESSVGLISPRIETASTVMDLGGL